MASWRSARLAVLAWSGSLLLAACAAPPQKEIREAEDALNAARTAGAERYAPEEFRATVDALARSHDAVAQRDYRLALSHALDARERAQTAATQAASQKALLRSQAEQGLAASEQLLDRLTVRVEAARHARVPSRRLAPVAAARSAVEQELQKARAALEREDYKAAREATGGLGERLQAAIEEVDAAIAARPTSPSRPRP